MAMPFYSPINTANAQQQSIMAPFNAAIGGYSDITDLQNMILRNELQKMQNKKSQMEMPYYGNQLEQQQLSRDLSNQIQQLNLKQMPQRLALDQQRLQNSLMQGNRNPLLGSSGAAGQAAAIDYYEKQGRPDLASMIREGMEKTGNLELKGWSTVPAKEKEALIAEGVGYGMNRGEVIERLQKGESLPDLAGIQSQREGTPLQEVLDRAPSFRATTPVQTSAQQSLARSSEARFLSRKSEELTGKYLDTAALASMPLDFVMDKIKGQNLDKRTDYLAGVALTVDASALQSMALGLRGITALQHVEDAGYVNVLQNMFTKNLISGKEYQEARRKLSDILDEGNNVYARYVENLGRPYKKESGRKGDSLGLFE